MLNKFLCAPHRQELTDKPEKAKAYCWKGLETGQNLSAFGHKRDALAHFGCAFETAEIVMSSRVMPALDAIGIFNATSCAFIACLKELGYHEQSQAVLNMCIDRLFAESLAFPRLTPTIQTLVISLQDFSLRNRRSREQVRKEIGFDYDNLNYSFPVQATATKLFH
ncbi:hypothetical protein Q4575_07715 [Psychrosphaera sp. 1_MG-2023]|uniref:Uncharacterized protein n=1 Tax=Psychrosphaera algicola TaxID=3023714 RepID=A0ABT5FBI0_9GAMM|nr:MULTISPECIES: hypothetical protein [unclassified Psychrosphaera]MDC2888895.1 hypothetical protein [Psychrosphaera sp. G1-22]MDO6719280.1 hypothetical protein [Psychrosphaera sp. 1_MG-2023]